MACCAKHFALPIDASGSGFSRARLNAHGPHYRCAIRCAAAAAAAGSAAPISPRDCRRALAVAAFCCFSASEGPAMSAAMLGLIALTAISWSYWRSSEQLCGSHAEGANERR